jgi:hypothetical protein
MSDGGWRSTAGTPRREKSPIAEPRIASRIDPDRLQQQERLYRLLPQRGVIASKPIERAIVEISEPQKAICYYESAAILALVTHMLCWSCGMYFSAANSSENDQGSMNLAS